MNDLPAYPRLISEGRIARRHEPTLMRMEAVVAACQAVSEPPPDLAEWFDELWDHVIRDGLPVEFSHLLVDLVHPGWSVRKPHEWREYSDEDLDELCERVAALLAAAPPRTERAPAAPEMSSTQAPEPSEHQEQPSADLGDDLGAIPAFLRRERERHDP